MVYFIFVKVNIHSPSLTLYSTFKKAVLQLDIAARIGDRLQQESQVKHFVDDYGTHYGREVTMGSSFSFESRYNKEETNNYSTKQKKECSTKSGARIFGIQAEKDESQCTGTLNDTTAGENTAVNRFSSTTIGSFPAGGGTLAEWSTQLQQMAAEGALMPSPIRRNMEPIVNVLKTDAAKNIVHEDGYFAGHKV